MDSLLKDHARDNPAQDPQSNIAAPQEIRFWIALDPVLADLHKHLVDAKAEMEFLSDRYGSDDPMAEVAADRVESAQCTVETRLIELRRNQEARAMVAAMISRAQALAHSESVERIRQKNNRFWKEFSAPRRPNAQKQASDSFWVMMASLAVLRESLSRTNTLLSIASTFSRASANDGKAFTPALAGSS